MKKNGRHAASLSVEELETRETPSAAPASAWVTVSQQSFDSTPAGQAPAGWVQWDSQGSFAVASGQGFGGAALVASTASNENARAWVKASEPADLNVSTSVLLSSMAPVGVLARGSGLDSATPTYYAATVTRGLQVQLLRVVNGTGTVLGALRSSDYVSGQWVRLSLEVDGTSLKVQVYRLDRGQYLTASGTWQSSPTWALTRYDSAIKGAGFVGLGRSAGYAGGIPFDDFQVTGPTRAGQTPAVYVQQSFNGLASGALAPGWAQWSDQAPAEVSTFQAASGSRSLALTTANSKEVSQAWLGTAQPADIEVSASVYLNSLAPLQVFARGSNLDGATPSYYAAAITRGLQVQLLRVVNGKAAVLGTLYSRDYVTNRWVRVALQVEGSALRVRVYRLDTGQYLNSSGYWQDQPADALDRTDTALTGGGLVGVARPAAYAGTVFVDNFGVATPDTQAPTVSLSGPAAGAVVTSPATFQANAADNVGIGRVEFYLDGTRVTADYSSPYTWTLNPAALADGTHTVAAWAYDLAGNVAKATRSVTVSTASVPTVNIPQHYSWIRLAELAYSGMTFGSIEDQLLRNSIDLVIPNAAYLDDINAVAPNTPQLIYSNLSSVYGDSLIDWLNWADAHGYGRESAFYHVTHALAFSGDSAGSQPVNWFWGVYRGGLTANFVDQTYASHSLGQGVALGDYGESLYVGYPDRFREINFNLISGASNGWSAVVEYASAVDATGQPTAWKALPLLTNTTAGFTRSGQLTFDPPADWKTAAIGGSARLYYVRVRTVHTGTAPVARTILGRDYVNARGGSSGVIPAFDYAADLNHDGYLNDAEYARRHPGMDARFAYEGRVFQGSYGQMRPATNPSSAGFRAWAVDYDFRYLRANPLADGLFVDNSNGRAPVLDADVVESTTTYGADYGSMLNAVARAVAPKWLIVNTAGGGTNADGVVRQNTAYFEEFALRPLAHNWQQFEDMAEAIAHRQGLRTPSPYAVLDSLPTGGSPTDPRTQLATLAYYYLLADPKYTFLDFYGGYAPATPWSQHWSPAVTYNVGKPAGEWYLFASGSDPSNRALTYHVYARQYTNALVLYKPLSYAQGATSKGTLANATATTMQLGGTYRPLRADGTLGSPVTSISLRNGEGAILVRV